jgi:hypothetical protein
VGGPCSTEETTRLLGPDHCCQIGVMVVDDHFYFSSVSALSESCGFRMISYTRSGRFRTAIPGFSYTPTEVM